MNVLTVLLTRSASGGCAVSGFGVALLSELTAWLLQPRADGSSSVSMQAVDEMDFHAFRFGDA